MLCFSGCSDAFTSSNLPTTVFSGITVLAYWDDLFVSSKTWQGIYYAAQGTQPNRILIFEYYLSHYNAPTNYTHFQMSFFENIPNQVRINYFEVDDLSATSTVGIQGNEYPAHTENPQSLEFSPDFLAPSVGSATLYSYKLTGRVTPNMVLTFMTNVGTYAVVG